MENQLYNLIQLIANQCFDGHFTIMKFTTNYRISFGGQPNDRHDIEKMASGKTLQEAFINLFRNE